jgi:hypothetical protein
MLPMRHRKPVQAIYAIAVGFALACSHVPMASTEQAADLADYRDPAGRFTFAYPVAFGTPLPGTNDGFGDRVAAIRFSTFSPGGIGGEAALTKTAPMLDVQSAGGLYDAIAREALTAPLLSLVERELPRLTAANICEQLGRERHLDVGAAAFASVAEAQRNAIGELDRLGNVAPTVSECIVLGNTVAFLKEAAAVDGGPRRRVYGAVRFLPEPYSTFQLIRAGGTVDQALLSDMRRLVDSWR